MTGALVAAWDLATKAWVLRNLDLYEVRTVFPGWFDLVHVRNPGVAFSLLATLDPAWVRPALIAVTFVEIGALLCFVWFLPAGGDSLGLGMILGGAAGNLADRARFGYVVDFVDIYRGRFHWPTFNWPTGDHRRDRAAGRRHDLREQGERCTPSCCRSVASRSSPTGPWSPSASWSACGSAAGRPTGWGSTATSSTTSGCG
jgi:signal peptidase II